MNETTRYTDEQVEAMVLFLESMDENAFEAAMMLHSLKDDCTRLQAENESLRADRQRYFQLRDNPEDRDVLNTGMPWVVRVELVNGVPTMNAIYGPELDHELDSARAKKGDV